MRSNRLPKFPSTGTNNGLKSRLDMKDNSKCITISLSTSTWSHCFVGIEVNLGSVYIVITMGLLKWLIYQVYTILLDQFPSPWIIWFYEPYSPHFCTSSVPQPTVVTSIYHNVFIKGNETMLQTIYFFINDIIENQG